MSARFTSASAKGAFAYVLSAGYVVAHKMLHTRRNPATAGLPACRERMPGRAIAQPTAGDSDRPIAGDRTLSIDWRQANGAFMRAARFELATFDGIRAIARLIALAAAIVPSVAYADPATVVINGFTIGANAAPGAFVFAPLNTMGQAWSLYAQAGAGAPQSTSGSVADWGNVNATAATLTSMASVSTLQATDPLTQLPTPMFTLAAFVAGANNWAAGTMASFGSFCFGDGTSFDGTSAGCNVAGELTFTVYYDLIVGSIPGESYAGAALQVANGDGSISALLSDFASPEAGGSRFDQFFTFTLLLGAGESASFDLSGTVRAGTVAAQVPEPNALALLTLGLLALAAARRRRRR